MKLLKIQIEAIARNIRAQLFEKSTKEFSAKSRKKFEDYKKKFQTLNENKKKIEDEMNAMSSEFQKEFKITPWSNLSIEEMIRNHIEYTIPSTQAIEGEICMQAAFTKGDDAEAFTKKVIESLEKKK